MIVLGLVLLVVGWLVGLSILEWLGIVLLVIGLVLLLIGHTQGPVVGGRRYWY